MGRERALPAVLAARLCRPADSGAELHMGRVFFGGRGQVSERGGSEDDDVGKRFGVAQGREAATKERVSTAREKDSRGPAPRSPHANRLTTGPFPRRLGRRLPGRACPTQTAWSSLEDKVESSRGREHRRGRTEGSREKGQQGRGRRLARAGSRVQAIERVGRPFEPVSTGRPCLAIIFREREGTRRAAGRRARTEPAAWARRTTDRDAAVALKELCEAIAV
jgi:hypothetical protein